MNQVEFCVTKSSHLIVLSRYSKNSTFYIYMKDTNVRMCKEIQKSHKYPLNKVNKENVT